VSPATKKPALVIRRLIAAPRERVFKAWTDPEQFAYWWGPHTFTAPKVKLDVRPGGKIDVHMQGPKGSPWSKPYPMGGEFREVSPYDRLVFTSNIGDGKVHENLNEVDFEDVDGKTRLTLTVTVLRTTPEFADSLKGMEQGWTQSLERLESLSLGRIEKHAHLAAPVSRVWKALTDHREFGAWFGVAVEGPFKAGEPSRGRLTHPRYTHVVWNAEVVDMKPESLFSFTWHPYGIDPKVDYSQEKPTLVEFRLAAGPAGSHLVIVESGFDDVPAPRRAEAFRMNDGGWTVQTENLAAYLAKNP
jgi:uncharacterized protein YndB with AHSA1/START domain